MRFTDLSESFIIQWSLSTCVHPPGKLICEAAYLATCSPIIVSPGLEKKLGTILHKNSQTDSLKSQAT